MENNLFKEYRKRSGISLRQMSGMIKGLGYKRMCDLENDPGNTRIKVHELMMLFKIMSLTESERRNFVDWLAELYNSNE